MRAMPINGKTEAPPVSDEVYLKPLFGIRPGVYLTVIYGLVLAVVLCALIILPGIIRPGSLVSFGSEPYGCAVRLNDTYIGTTPFSAFVPSGQARFTFHSPGFTVAETAETIGSRPLFSLFFPLQRSVSANLRCEDPVSTLGIAAAEFSAWTAVGESGGAYPVPRTISDAVYRLGPYTADPKNSLAFTNILRTLARRADSRGSINELCRSWFLSIGAGQALSPTAALNSLRQLVEYISEAEGSANWLNSVFGDALPAEIRESAWFIASTRNISSSEAEIVTTESETKREIQLADRLFVHIKGGTIKPEGFINASPIPSFWIAAKETEMDNWAAFIADNPEWGEDQAETLKRKGLIGDGYLETWDDPSYPSPSQSGVSWEAASAYCRWLSARLPAELSAYTVRLPSEIEWEYAASINTPSVQGLMGGLWEWCHNSYVPFPYLPAYGEDFSGDKAVRGGSWINAAGSVKSGTRASLASDTCSPFVGFRPVIVAESAL